MEPSILEAYVKDKLDEIQSSLLERAISFRDRFSPSLILFPRHRFWTLCKSNCCFWAWVLSNLAVTIIPEIIYRLEFCPVK